jgi:hypothetical protein
LIRAVSTVHAIMKTCALCRYIGADHLGSEHTIGGHAICAACKSGLAIEGLDFDTGAHEWTATLHVFLAENAECLASDDPLTSR